MLFSRLRAASSLVSDCVMALSRRSMSSCSAANASACFRVASACSREAFVAFDSASPASDSCERCGSAWGDTRLGGCGGWYLLPLKLLLGAKARQQRIQAFEIGINLNLIVQIIFDPSSLMRRQSRDGGHCWRRRLAAEASGVALISALCPSGGQAILTTSHLK